MYGKENKLTLFRKQFINDMKIQSFSLLATAVGFSTLMACNSSNEQPKQSDSDTTQSPAGAEAPAKAIKLAPFADSPEFPGATLTIKDVKTEMVGTDSVKVTLNYDVKNYELKQQTSSATAGECNNSKDGQHIHFILDNKPYMALYNPTHTFTVPVNSEHYLMSFLSRSYHESLKNKEAGTLLHFSVDAKGVYKKLDNPSTPMLFYSRPKGDYVGNDTKNVLLDFYVYNTTLSADGHKVKATINGNSFTIDSWKPQFIQNAPMGAMKVKLELIDKDGKVVSGENTSIERDVQLAQSEPVR